MEAAQRYLQAKDRYQVGSEDWAEATARAFCMLRTEVCAEVAKPEWWNDEGLKTLSARVVRAAPNDEKAISMRALVLSGLNLKVGASKPEPRSAAELKEAAAYFDRSSVLFDASVLKLDAAQQAGWCRRKAAVMMLMGLS